MSIVCSSNYSMDVVASIPDPFAYYKLDVASGVAGSHKALDSMPGAYNTNQSNATATIVSGKISDSWNFTGTTTYLAPGAPFLFTGKSFLIRMWIKVDDTPAGWGFNLSNFITDGTSYRLQLYPFATGSTFKVTAYALNTAFNFTSTFELDSTWRRLILYYNVNTTTMYMKLDNNAAESLVVTGGLFAGSQRFDLSGSSTGFLNIDELGFWKDTDADDYWNNGLTADWNGGAGITYP